MTAKRLRHFYSVLYRSGGLQGVGREAEAVGDLPQAGQEGSAAGACCGALTQGAGG